MDSIIRALCVYLFLLVLFRIAGKRTLAEVSTFDAVLLLIISEAIQQALIGNDSSMTNAFVVVATLVGCNLLFSLLKRRSGPIDRAVEGVPIVLVKDGELLRERMLKERVDEDDVLHAARLAHGLTRIEQIRYAILECRGGITIIPREG
ncbi:MAG: DUF421 domain-containing protein [Planctomycetes bacterium]|nr:DUF421 domain-containing protein [Planctomycetota bacterium]